MKLTDRQKASGLTLTDIIHVVLTNDTTQDPQGSSYKADMGQIIDLVPKYWTSGSTGSFGIKTVNDSGTDATGDYAVASGFNTLASEIYSFAEGHNTTASGQASHAEGQNTTANSEASHAEGYLTVAADFGAHAEGVSTAANGYGSHAEGYNTTANGAYSHVEGQDTTTVGDNSHAEGYLTQAIGSHSHAEGYNTIANGHASHSGGQDSIASGDTSFVHGDNSQANNLNTIVFGANIIGNNANTTYVDKFNIKTLLTGTSINNLGIDSNGNVIVGSNGGTSGSTTDIFMTGMTLNISNYDLNITRNDGNIVTTNLGLLASDIKVTGGTYNINTGNVTFTNNSGGTFNVTGFTSGMTDTYVSSGVLNNGTAIFTRTNGSTFNVTGFTNLQKTITTNYTISDTDNNYSIMVNNGATPITILIPTGLGSKINVGFIQQGSGDVTFSGSVGVTINTPLSGGYKIKGVNYNGYVEQVSATNVYQLLGNLKV